MCRETPLNEATRSPSIRNHSSLPFQFADVTMSMLASCIWTRGGLPAVRHFGMDPRGCGSFAGPAPHPAGALRAPQHPSHEDLSKAVPHPLPNVTVFQTHWARTWHLCEGQGPALCRLVILAPSIGQADRSLRQDSPGSSIRRPSSPCMCVRSVSRETARILRRSPILHF